jgi:hypothetical protein
MVFEFLKIELHFDDDLLELFFKQKRKIFFKKYLIITK